MEDDFFADINFLTVNPTPGKLLISEPFLFDPYFKRTVIFLVEHNDKGALGFILNRPIPMELTTLIENFPVIDTTLCYGGPVSNSNIFFIHTLGDRLNGSIKVTKNIYWGGDFEQLKILIDLKQVKSSEIRFFVGYSGWEPNQLKMELKERSWIVANCTTQQVMSGMNKDFWKNSLKKLGKKFEVLSNSPEDPRLN